MHLYHYTCSHQADQIARQRWLTPHPHLLLPEPLVWLTDLDQPDRAALGLTSRTLACDRTEHRVVAVTDNAVRWTTYARSLGRRTREELAAVPGVLPSHWWVSVMPVPILSITRLHGGA